MADDLTLIPERNAYYLKDLWKCVLYEKGGNDKLWYMGMQNLVYTLPMFDAMAWLIRDVITGKTPLPSKSVRDVDEKKWQKKLADAEATADIEEIIRFQSDYLQDLIGQSDYPSWDCKKTAQLFIDWKDNKVASLMKFRDGAHESVHGSGIAEKNPNAWWDIFDDSYEAYINPKVSDTAD